MRPEGLLLLVAEVVLELLEPRANEVVNLAHCGVAREDLREALVEEEPSELALGEAEEPDQLEAELDRIATPRNYSTRELLQLVSSDHAYLVLEDVRELLELVDLSSMEYVGIVFYQWVI